MRKKWTQDVSRRVPPPHDPRPTDRNTTSDDD